MSAHFLGKMVDKACINRKEAQFHSYLALPCGFNKEIEWIEGILEEVLSQYLSLILPLILSLISPYEPYGNSLSK